MKSDAVARRETAALMMKSLRSAHHREQLASVGHESGHPILVVLESDTLGEVLGRIVDERAPAPAILAMRREQSNSVVIWSFRPSDPSQNGRSKQQPASTASTIGLLFDTMQAAGIQTIDLELNWATAPTSLRADELVDAN